jgi:hypothetical protein
MNSRVAFRLGSRRDIEVRTLVYPEDYASQQARDNYLSVLTSLGAALIGLRVGTGMSYPASSSTTQHVTVEAVLHQPDGAERETAASGRRNGASPVRRTRDPWNGNDPGPAAA